MTATVLRLATGHLRVSRIVYLSDLLRSDSREIPIGVVVEARVDGLKGIGAALRPALSDDELALVGPIMRAKLQDPMPSLWPQIAGALFSECGSSPLDVLCSQFRSSLSMLAPKALSVPRQWLLDRPIEEMEEIVRDGMHSVLTNEYFDLLFPNPSTPDPRVDERLEKLAA